MPNHILVETYKIVSDSQYGAGWYLEVRDHSDCPGLAEISYVEVAQPDIKPTVIPVHNDEIPALIQALQRFYDLHKSK